MESSTRAAHGAGPRGIASLGVPIWITLTTSWTTLRAAALGPEFVEAWRHVHLAFAASGATNAVGCGSSPAPSGLDRVEQSLWGATSSTGLQWGVVQPGRVWSPGGSTRRAGNGFQGSLVVFHDWLAQHAARVGIDPAKPEMISEGGLRQGSEQPRPPQPRGTETSKAPSPATPRSRPVGGPQWQQHLRLPVLRNGCCPSRVNALMSSAQLNLHSSPTS